MPHQQAAVRFCLKRGLLAVLPVGFGPILWVFRRYILPIPVYFYSTAI